MWDQTINQCIPCLKGYFGANCEIECPFPYHGLKCVQECNCDIEDCHHENGCRLQADHNNHFNITTTPDRIESKCYVNHKWDFKERKCAPCPQGYFGVNCTSECVLPYYGLKCNLKCNCSLDDCHHIHGCNQTLWDNNNTAGDKYTNINGQTITTKTESKWMRSVMFGIFGLAGLLFFVTVIYMYSFTHQQINRIAVAETT